MSTKYTGTVLATRRAGMSRMGNPAFDVAIQTDSGDVVILTTATNSGLGYEITNPDYKYTPRVFTLNGHGKITSAKKVTS